MTCPWPLQLPQVLEVVPFLTPLPSHDLQPASLSTSISRSQPNTASRKSICSSVLRAGCGGGGGAWVWARARARA
jgi:hypothetical protein